MKTTINKCRMIQSLPLAAPLIRIVGPETEAALGIKVEENQITVNTLRALTTPAIRKQSQTVKSHSPSKQTLAEE